MPVEVVGTWRDIPDEGNRWSVHFALFSRVPFTPTAWALPDEQRAMLVDLKRLDGNLSS